MQLHQLKRNKVNRRSRQIGRGGKRGTTSGRGTKGQKARAGHKIRPELRDIIKKLPKLRGYRFKARTDLGLQVVNLNILEKVFTAGETVSPTTLLAKKIIEKKSNRLAGVKILATGTLTKNLTVKGCSVSANAREKIEKVGGVVLPDQQAGK